LRIAFFDDQAGGTRVFDLQTNQDILLHSSEGQVGSWSFDSKKMLFIDSNPADLNPHDHIYEVNFEIQATHPLPDPVSEADVIYSVPELAPDGELLAIGLRYANGPFSKQIWLMQEDGTQAHPLTENQVFNQAAYSWDPFGKGLVYQRLELGSSQTRPEVVIWQRDSGNFVTIAKDAGQPKWLP
jgi:dipeptidyl aminopeptidase/acylaminoacyl peptidase